MRLIVLVDQLLRPTAPAPAGLSSIFSALATSLPLTTFAQNNGVISLTAVASRQAGWVSEWLRVRGPWGGGGAAGGGGGPALSAVGLGAPHRHHPSLAPYPPPPPPLQACAIWLFLMGVLAKFGGIITSIPDW